MRIPLLLLPSLLLSVDALAIKPIPKEDGFSGFINLGVGGVSVESNTLAKFNSVDLSDDSIESVNQSPSSEESAIPVFAGELAYTFAKTRTQLFVGNQFEDYIRFDFSTLFGVRQDIGRAGLIGASFLYTPLATDVWEDPFLTGEPRTSSDRTANGYRLIWDEVYGTGLEFRYAYREVDIDTERSGESLEELTAADRALLDRNGDIHRFTVKYAYDWQTGGMKHVIEPSLAYASYDTDGDAMAIDGAALGITYAFDLERWSVVSNLYYSGFSADDIHPVYNQKYDSNQYGLSLAAFYKRPFGWKNWAANASVAWFEDDNDIDFYDGSVSLISAGMLYTF